MKPIRLAFGIGLILATLVVQPSAAQTSQGLSGLGLNVSPAKLELSMTPGSFYNVPVTIQNGSADATHIQASMVDFDLSSNGDYQFAKAGSDSNSLMRWATINPREFDLAGGMLQQVRLSLAVPKTANLSGEYAGIVFFQTRPMRRAHAVSFSVRIATKIYVTIPGTVKVAGAIAKMTASSGHDGELYHVLFKNTGNAHVYVGGNLEVRKGGQLVERIALPPNELVERGGQRLLEISGKPLSAGKYQAIALVDYGGSTMTGGEIEFEKR
jgi:P pilus assembly chaperone PapD